MRLKTHVLRMLHILLCNWNSDYVPFRQHHLYDYFDLPYQCAEMYGKLDIILHVDLHWFKSVYKLDN